MAKGSSSYKRIDSLTKALEIIEFLARQKEPVSGIDIAAAVGLPTGTVMCHLATLQDRNYIRLIGGGVELGMGAANLWARKKSLLEGQRDQITREIKSLEEGN